MNDFTVNVEHRPDGAVAHLKGNAVNAHSQRLPTALAELLRQRTTRVVIDLAELQYIASMTLAELLQFRQEMQTYGGRIHLAGANKQIHDVFKQTRLAELFPIYKTSDEALAATPPTPNLKSEVPTGK